MIKHTNAKSAFEFSSSVCCIRATKNTLETARANRLSNCAKHWFLGISSQLVTFSTQLVEYCTQLVKHSTKLVEYSLQLSKKTSSIIKD